MRSAARYTGRRPLQNSPRWACCILLWILLAGCSVGALPTTPTIKASIAATQPAVMTPAPTLKTDTPPAPELTAAPVTTEPCGYQWASQPLPSETETLQAALDQAGLSQFTARAEAYGENCVTASGQVAAFLTMQTDFHLLAGVADINDDDLLGQQVEAVLAVLSAFPPGTFPGPQRGYVGITFSQGQQTRRLWFRLASAQQALEEGQRGSALLNWISAAE